jgi:hypothetical protein
MNGVSVQLNRYSHIILGTIADFRRLMRLLVVLRYYGMTLILSGRREEVGICPEILDSKAGQLPLGDMRDDGLSLEKIFSFCGFSLRFQREIRLELATPVAESKWSIPLKEETNPKCSSGRSCTECGIFSKKLVFSLNPIDLAGGTVENPLWRIRVFEAALPCPVRSKKSALHKKLEFMLWATSSLRERMLLV